MGKVSPEKVSFVEKEHHLDIGEEGRRAEEEKDPQGLLHPVHGGVLLQNIKQRRKYS